MLLCSVYIGFAQVSRTNGAFDGNLDRFCRFEFNDIDDFIRRNFVKITNQIFIDRFGGTNLFKIFEGFEHNVQRQLIRAGVFAADNISDISQFWFS